MFAIIAKTYAGPWISPPALELGSGTLGVSFEMTQVVVKLLQSDNAVIQIVLLYCVLLYFCVVFFTASHCNILHFNATYDWPNTAAAITHTVSGAVYLMELTVRWWHPMTMNAPIDMIGFKSTGIGVTLRVHSTGIDFLNNSQP